MVTLAMDLSSRSVVHHNVVKSQVSSISHKSEPLSRVEALHRFDVELDHYTELTPLFYCIVNQALDS